MYKVPWKMRKLKTIDEKEIMTHVHCSTELPLKESLFYNLCTTEELTNFVGNWEPETGSSH